MTRTNCFRRLSSSSQPCPSSSSPIFHLHRPRRQHPSDHCHPWTCPFPSPGHCFCSSRTRYRSPGFCWWVSQLPQLKCTNQLTSSSPSPHRFSQTCLNPSNGYFLVSLATATLELCWQTHFISPLSRSLPLDLSIFCVQLLLVSIAIATLQICWSTHFMASLCWRTASLAPISLCHSFPLLQLSFFPASWSSNSPSSTGAVPLDCPWATDSVI